MYLAASPPLFSPLMGPLDVSTGRQSSTIHRRPFRAQHQQQALAPFTTLDINFGNMTLAPALVRSAAEAGLFGRRAVNRSSTGQGGQTGHVSTAPLRSCLVIRTGEESTDASSGSEPSSPVDQVDSSPCPATASPTRSKKQVVFADEKGLSLTQVKMMTEPSDCPPRWTAEFLEQVTGGASAEVAADRWELTFAQPASDYLDFRARLERQNVSLENVVVQDADQLLVGTIKVKNLAFTKHVAVRVTFDNWQSQTDVDATYVPTGLQGSNTAAAINLFDTFSFKIPIPSVVASNRIQFCLRYTSEAGEFWDNNIGKNYVIVKPVELTRKDCIDGTAKRVNKGRDVRSGLKYPDLLTPGSKVDYWANFASWDHLVNDSPYW